MALEAGRGLRARAQRQALHPSDRELDAYDLEGRASRSHLSCGVVRLGCWHCWHCSAVLGRLRVERRANGDASSVMAVRRGWSAGGCPACRGRGTSGGKGTASVGTARRSLPERSRRQGRSIRGERRVTAVRLHFPSPLARPTRGLRGPREPRPAWPIGLRRRPPFGLDPVEQDDCCAGCHWRGRGVRPP